MGIRPSERSHAHKAREPDPKKQPSAQPIGKSGARLRRSGRFIEGSPERNPSRSPGHCAGRSGRFIEIRPLKSHDPPPELIDHASEDAAEDLSILHEAAILAAEGFPALCG